MSANIIEQLQRRAMANPQRVVFPEANEAKILQAAHQIREMGLAKPYLVGNPGIISELAATLGVSIEGISLVDSTDRESAERLAKAYSESNPDFPASAIKRKFKDPLYFAAVMVALGEADCLVAGLSHTTGEVIMCGEMIVGLKEGVSTVSSMGILSVPGFEGPEGNLLAIADCAVCPAPDSSELADIAISTADSVRALLGWEPRIALLSFSTKGSASHESVDKILTALEMIRERRADLLVDGELQLDAAIAPEVAARKVGEESPVAGRANVLIFPDLNSGNIGVKLVQRFAGGVAYGPFLQGFARPISDLSRGAPVAEIVGAATMAAICAQLSPK